jgi:hypothetical protein
MCCAVKQGTRVPSHSSPVAPSVNWRTHLTSHCLTASMLGLNVPICRTSVQGVLLVLLDISLGPGRTGLGITRLLVIHSWSGGSGGCTGLRRASRLGLRLLAPAAPWRSDGREAAFFLPVFQLPTADSQLLLILHFRHCLMIQFSMILCSPRGKLSVHASGGSNRAK